jgi:hypothetical protein
MAQNFENYLEHSSPAPWACPSNEGVLDWLIENYAPPQEAIDPEKNKHWRDTIFLYGGPPNYIDYLIEIDILTNSIGK